MSCNCKVGCSLGYGCRRTDMPCSPIGNCVGLTILQQCTGTDWRFEGLTWGRTDCWPLDRAKLVVIVDVAVVEQTCPVPLSTAVWDLHATVKWQCQTFWKSDEEILWILAAEVNANMTSCVFCCLHILMCMCFMHQYLWTFEWSWVIFLYPLNARGKIPVEEMLVIYAINFHVADIRCFGTLDKVKFDLSSFCARKMITRPFFSLPRCLNFLDKYEAIVIWWHELSYSYMWWYEATMMATWIKLQLM